MVELVRWREPIVALPGVDAGAVPGVRAADRTIENLVLVLFWLVILEGALRKWILPEYSRWLFFVRDPFLLVLYWQALRIHALRKAGPLLWIGIGFACVSVVLAFVQSISLGDSRMMPILIYGWRQYFLYLPLPFVMAEALDRQSLTRFARHAFVAVTMTAPLVLAQYAAPPSAVINRGSADDAALQFQAFSLVSVTASAPAGPSPRMWA